MLDIVLDLLFLSLAVYTGIIPRPLENTVPGTYPEIPI